MIIEIVVQFQDHGFRTFRERVAGVPDIDEINRRVEAFLLDIADLYNQVVALEAVRLI